MIRSGVWKWDTATALQELHNEGGEQLQIKAAENMQAVLQPRAESVSGCTSIYSRLNCLRSVHKLEFLRSKSH